MDNEKERDCGCGVRGCGRSKPNGECAENTSGCNSGSESPEAWGERVANSAVAGMCAHNAKEGVCLSDEMKIKEEDIDGFIEKCDKEGKNPLDVVNFIAEQNGIDLSSAPRGDSMKLRLYELLKGVVRKVLFVFVSYCADNYGLGVLQSIVGSVGNTCGSGSCRESDKSVPRSADKEYGVPAMVFPVRIVHVRIGRAFTW